MTQNRKPEARSIERKEERDLSLLGRARLCSVIGTGFLALTYVSGYLIATTYLATYGISADASEFLRAKYIYIGCQYWMFVAFFGIMARLIAVFLDLPGPRTKVERPTLWIDHDNKWQGPSNAAEKIQVKKKVIAELSRRSGADYVEGPWLHLRWVIVVALILAIFAFEIMLLKPGDFSKYLPLHAILLLSISLYQTTFYLEYSKKYDYSWGLLHGNSQVERMRWIYSAWIGIPIALLIIGTGLSPALSKFIVSSKFLFWIIGTLCIAAIAGACIFVTISAEDLSSLADTNRKWWRTLWLTLALPFRKRTFPWKSIAFPTASGFYCWVALRVLYNDDSYWRIWVLYYGTLMLALIVLSNLITLTLMNREMHKQLGRPFSVPLKNWILIGVVVTVLYVVSVFSFSYLIYPFIPFQKAGGKYLANYAVTVDPTQSIGECSLPRGSVFNDPAKQFIVLEEDTNWTYLAPLIKDSDDDPDRWGHWAFCKEKYGAEATCRPKIYAVNRRCIANTEGVGDGRSKSRMNE